MSSDESKDDNFEPPLTLIAVGVSGICAASMLWIWLPIAVCVEPGEAIRPMIAFPAAFISTLPSIPICGLLGVL
jgi:hypothetical protein